MRWDNSTVWQKPSFLFTQAELAKELGVSFQRVHSWTKGVEPRPAIKRKLMEVKNLKERVTVQRLLMEAVESYIAYCECIDWDDTKFHDAYRVQRKIEQLYEIINEPVKPLPSYHLTPTDVNVVVDGVYSNLNNYWHTGSWESLEYIDYMLYLVTSYIEGYGMEDE